MLATMKQYINALDDLLDDLTIDEYHDLLTYLWCRKMPPTRASIKGWRTAYGKKND